MIDPTVERTYPLAQAAARGILPARPGGGVYSFNTLLRWSRDGHRLPGGDVVKLETLRSGRTLCTSDGALLRFMERLTSGGRQDQRTASQAGRAHQRADAILAAEGL